MKLLLDANLSRSLIPRISESFPKLVSRRYGRTRSASDEQIWEFARDEEFVIVSKEEDLRRRAPVFGPPPKVIWVRLGRPVSREAVPRVTIHRASPLRALVGRIIESRGSLASARR